MARRNFIEPPYIEVHSTATDVQRSVDLLDDFIYQKIESDEDGKDLHIFTDQSAVISDVSFAARLSGATYQAIIDRMNMSKKSADALAALRSKLSDQQLMDTIKSKYIQTPSELIAYMRSVDSDFNLAAEKILDEINGKSSNVDQESPTQDTNSSNNKGAE